MDEKSTATHEFHRGKVDGDGSSLYKSFQFVNGTGGTMDNKVLESGTHCKNGEKYCSQIEKHNSWGGEPEIQSLAMHDDAFIQFNCHSPSYEVERPTETSVFNETKQVYDMIIPSTNRNFSIKRKSLGHASLSFATNFEQELSSPISNNNDDGFDRLTKFTKFDSESTTVEELLQTDISDNDSITMKSQQSATDLSIILNQPHQEPEMKFEVEPVLRFRGRTSHDFKPLKERNRNGKPSEIRPPRYFADRNNHHYFKLLIPDNCLLPTPVENRLQICMVTREINGFNYIHPYFKFQVDRYNKNIPDENPIFLTFDVNELKNYSQGIKQLKLKLVVIVLTNRELKKIKQPLDVFSSNSIGSGMTRIFKKLDTFKDAYDLQDLRFAVTLWTKWPGEEEFRPTDIQYISEVSTEDRKFKIRRTNISNS